MATKTLPRVLYEIPLHRTRRIVAGLEGDWSPTEVEVWSRENRRPAFATVTRSHRVHRPSLELYLDDAWIGLRCFERRGGENVFDEDLARTIIEFVEASLV